MNLHDAECLAISLMAEHGLDALGWSFGWNNRKRAYGLCNYTRKEISLSKPLCKGEPADSVRHTILHEIAHALCPVGVKHGRLWQLKCRELGIDPDWKRAPAERPAYKYVVMFGDQVITGYYKYPRAMARRIHTSFLPGRREETYGKLRLVEAA
ncbi:MAG: SprT-like domain-containing protein [Planctomycetota bacterium]|jgi:hypothetical protein